MYNNIQLTINDHVYMRGEFLIQKCWQWELGFSLTVTRLIATVVIYQLVCFLVSLRIIEDIYAFKDMR